MTDTASARPDPALLPALRTAATVDVGQADAELVLVDAPAAVSASAADRPARSVP